MKHLLAVILLSFFSACAPRVQEQVHFDPAEPLRIAVLPFQRFDRSGKPLVDEGRLFVDNIPLLSKKQEETPAQIARRLTLAELEKTNLDVIDPIAIDLGLPHHGFARQDGTLDIDRLMQTPASDLCRTFLSCDAVLYGSVTRWDRQYFAIQSVDTVGVSLKLVSATDDRTLFESSVVDPEGRGLTKGPTGFSSLVIEPVRGLDSAVIVDLARRVIARALQPLQIRDRPASGNPPSIYAAAHNGAHGPVSSSHPLMVVLFGSEGQQGSFSIGSRVSGVPMIERSRGHYYGEWVPLPDLSVQDEPVSVTLEDRFGRTAQQEIPGAGVTQDHKERGPPAG